MLQSGTRVAFCSPASDLEKAMSATDLEGARAVANLATGERILGKKGQLARRENVQS